MASFNKVMLIGNLTRDPEVRYTPKGTAVCDLGLAVNRVYSTDAGERQEEVTFLDVTPVGPSGRDRPTIPRQRPPRLYRRAPPDG
jgi:single stranded DNA-binding protein